MNDPISPIVGYVDSDAHGIRLDQFCVQQTSGMPADFSLSRNRIKYFIQQGYVLVDGIVADDPAHRVRCGQQVQIHIPLPEDSDLKPLRVVLDILYEDDDLLVLNKPAGMVVHPAPGHQDDTLVNALIHHCGTSLSGIGGVKRPGIVHRLDKDTSGLMVVAKHDQAHQILSSQFKDRTLSRRYWAIVWGILPITPIHVSGYMGRHPVQRQRMAMIPSDSGSKRGKYSETIIHLKQHLPPYASWVECELKTGRTHQIRLHLCGQGFPIVGDPVYHANRRSMDPDTNQEQFKMLVQFPRQALHAYHLSFIHPTTQSAMNFTVDLPQDMIKII